MATLYDHKRDDGSRINKQGAQKNQILEMSVGLQLANHTL